MPFDPDAYLKQFDPNAYLAQNSPAPSAPSLPQPTQKNNGVQLTDKANQLMQERDQYPVGSKRYDKLTGDIKNELDISKAINPPDKKSANEENQIANTDALISKIQDTVLPAWKRAQDEGFLGKMLNPGRIRGLGAKIEGMIGENPAARAYGGLQPEMTVSMARAASGNIRPGPQIMEEFGKAVPQLSDNWQEVAEKINNAVHFANSQRAPYAGEPYDEQATQGKVNQLLQHVMPPNEYQTFVKRMGFDSNQNTKGSQQTSNPYGNLSNEELMKRLNQ